jgi:hypothetical protein
MTRAHRFPSRLTTPTVLGRDAWSRAILVVGIAALTAVLGGHAAPAHARPQVEPLARAASVCGDYPDQAAAQRAADTRDGDGDGIYCESLPCPCLKPGDSGGSGGGGSDEPAAEPTTPSCQKPVGVQSISFSETKYPKIKAHAERAIAKGWPKVLVLNRPGADARRERLLPGTPTKRGYDRDEYPPAVGRGRGAGLTKGSDPRGWRADVAYVPSSENRSHGATLGIKLRRFCNGTKFKYVFY